jgi:hypothetical protein
MPSDITVSCDAIPSPINPVVSDCSDVVIEIEEITTMSDCPSNYDILRTYIATDQCGLIASHSHTIHVVDNEAPLLTNLPSNLQLECGSVPPIAPVEAIDNCSGVTTLEFIETNTEGSSDQEICQLSTPEAIFGDVALWLPGLTGITANYVFVGTPTLVRNMVNGTALIQAEVANSTNPNQGWMIELHLVNAQNWTDWSSLGRSYKDDLNMALNHHAFWTYYELASTSFAQGLNDLNGSQLQLTHAPSTYYYGFQLGERANNRNMEYGISGYIITEPSMEHGLMAMAIFLQIQIVVHHRPLSAPGLPPIVQETARAIPKSFNWALRYRCNRKHRNLFCQNYK